MKTTAQENMNFYGAEIERLNIEWDGHLVSLPFEIIGKHAIGKEAVISLTRG